MTQVNADIILKKSTVSGEVPSAADLEVAEVAINTADGKLFTKHTDDSIKEISGKVSSVNGEVGDVSLGIQDMDDFELYPDLSGIATIQYDRSVSYGLTGGASPIRNGGIDGLAINVTSYDGQNSDTFWSGHPSNGTFWWSTDGGTTWSETSGSYTGYISQRWLGSVALHNSPSNAILTLTRDDPNTIPDTPLADGDHLQWVDADQAFKPVQLAAVATSGSYNDLTDLPPAAAVDSVNGETGAVSLGVQDMDDFALLLSEGSTWNYSSDNSDNADVGNTGVNDGKVTGKESGVSYQLYTLFFGDIDDAGLNRRADMLQAVTDGAVVSVFYDGVLAFSDVVTSPGGSANDFGRVALSFAGGNFFFPPSVGTTVGLALPGSPALPLAAGDMLKWDAAEQAFRPTQLATVATSGSYNDLSDQPVIPTVPVDSVNGETGAVSLGIQDMDDVRYLASSTFYLGDWAKVHTNAADTLGDGNAVNNSTYFRFAQIGANGDNTLQAFTEWVQGYFGVTFPAPGQTTAIANVQFDINWNDTVYTPTATGVRNRTDGTYPYIEIIVVDDMGISPSNFDHRIYIPGMRASVGGFDDGDILQWDNTDQKFKPAQLATVATSGDYNDLANKPTITAAPVESVNGETGVVSLGIQDMDDFGLIEPTQDYTVIYNENPDADGEARLVESGGGTPGVLGAVVLYVSDSNGESIASKVLALPATGSIKISSDNSTFYDYPYIAISAQRADGFDALPDYSNAVRFVFKGTERPLADTLGLAVTYTGPLYIQLAALALQDGDILEWNATDGKFKPTQLATVATSGSYNNLSDIPQDLVQVDTSTVLEGAQIYWDGTQWVAGVPPLSRGDGGDFDGGIILTQANAEVFGGGDFDSGFADSPFDGGEIT